MTVPNRLGRWVRIWAKCGLTQEPYRLKAQILRDVGRWSYDMPKVEIPTDKRTKGHATRHIYLDFRHVIAPSPHVPKYLRVA
jgi:hypothetical protein